MSAQGYTVMEHEIIYVNGLKKRFRTFERAEGKGLIAGMRRRYFYKNALQGVDFTVNEGELVALLGRNGSGKSTLIKLMTGILYPDSGTVRVMGMDPWKQRAKLAENMGAVLGAHSQLIWDLPASDSFEMMRRIYHIPVPVFDKRLKYFISRLSLNDVYKRQVRQMSLGEQMKCNFIASIIHLPKLVLLDEPTIGVDLPSKTALRETIFDMQRQFKTTFMLTTHIVEDISITKRIILLDNGRVVFDGTRSMLLSMFGNKKHVEITVDGRIGSGYNKLGKVLERSDDFIKLEVESSEVRSKRFRSMLNASNVIDYRVAEPDVGYVLEKFYKKIDRRKV
jgi:ABC-2 type transport system ATP-binding protein